MMQILFIRLHSFFTFYTNRFFLTALYFCAHFFITISLPLTSLFPSLLHMCKHTHACTHLYPSTCICSRLQMFQKNITYNITFTVFVKMYQIYHYNYN